MHAPRSIPETGLARVAVRLQRVCGIIAFLASAGLTLPASVSAQTPTPIPHFDLQLTTSRGCLESGQHPVYVVGESLTMIFRIGSTAVSSASATLIDRLPDGRVGIISFGQVATNRGLAFGARVSLPTGVEQLELKASAPGVATARRYCSFIVVASTTPRPTMTPRATATPQATRTPSNTPVAGALTALIRTSRGCQQTGDDPVFAVGEIIPISFSASSSTGANALMSIVDILPNGFTNQFSFGVLSTNVTYRFRGRIAPPTGIESLQLRARLASGLSATNTCSFRVVNGAVPTATRSTTATPSATATATATPTPP